MSGTDLSRFPVHLGLGASAEQEPEFTGEIEWYAGYGERHAGDGEEGRLVAMHTFKTSWDMWEMHPAGAEVVVCTAGSLTLIQEDATGATRSINLVPGQYAINPPGVWHTADVDDNATALFITAGAGTRHRPRY